MIVGVEVVWCGFMNGGCVISFEFGIKDLVCLFVVIFVVLVLVACILLSWLDDGWLYVIVVFYFL